MLRGGVEENLITGLLAKVCAACKGLARAGAMPRGPAMWGADTSASLKAQGRAWSLDFGERRVYLVRAKTFRGGTQPTYDDPEAGRSNTSPLPPRTCWHLPSHEPNRSTRQSCALKESTHRACWGAEGENVALEGHAEDVWDSVLAKVTQLISSHRTPQYP